MEKCLHVRTAWGDWQTFAPYFWSRSAPGYVSVEGVAGFTKGGCTVSVLWDLGSTPPRMVHFFLRSEQESIEFPTSPRIQLVDPPPFQGRKDVAG